MSTPVLFQIQTIDTAPEASKPILENVQKGLGFIPNLMATFANAPQVLKGYLALDSEWQNSSFTPSERQLVLLSASIENDCKYCIAAHSTIAKGMLHVPSETVAAIRSGSSTGDPKIDALVNLTREFIITKGHVAEATTTRFLEAGYTKTQIMELLLGISLKAISNYLDNLTPTPIDTPFQAEA